MNKKTKAEVVERNQDPTKEEYFWNQLALKYFLFVGFLMCCSLIIVLDISQSPIFQHNVMFRLVAKFVLIVIAFLTYVKLKNTLLESLFPKVNREIVKTIYKLAPEIKETKNKKNSHDVLAIRGHQAFITNYILLMSFVGAIISMLLLYPRFIDATVGMINDSSVAALIVRLIIAATLIGIYIAIRNLIMLKKEYENLEEMQWRIVNLCKNKVNMQNLDKTMPKNEDSIVTEKLKAIKMIKRIKGSVITADLQTYTFSHYQLSRTMLNYITSAMPILGLIGTIMGLMLSIGGLEQVMDQALNNQDSFAQNLGASLSGISTAFYTTLAGSISMLILRFFTLIFNNAYANFMSDLRNIIYTKVVPHLVDSDL